MQVTSPRSIVQRASARLTAVTPPRWRRILLALYLAAALGDATGKWLASSTQVNRIVARVAQPGLAVRMGEARRPRGNFEIFRAASRHLESGEDMYALYPNDLQDQFKYSPAFAMLFAPFAWLPWPLALFLWNALGVLVLFVAVERVLPSRPAMIALSFLLLEALRAMQNAQSNPLVAGLIILAFVAFERGKTWRGGALVALGASVKIFPLAALSFAIARRRALRAGLAAAAAGVALQLLPLLITSPATLVAQYRSWRAIESIDTTERWFSAMALWQRVAGTDWPNWPLQLAGTLVLLAPLVLRRRRWNESRFRLLYLSSLLLYVVLFNHQAERAAYVIAFAGMAIWFSSEPRIWWRTALFGVAFTTVTLMSTIIPVPGWLRSPDAMTFRLALPAFLIWSVLQWELLRAHVTNDDRNGSIIKDS